MIQNPPACLPRPDFLDQIPRPPPLQRRLAFFASVDFPTGAPYGPGNTRGVETISRRAVAAYSEFGIQHPECQAMGFASCSEEYRLGG